MRVISNGMKLISCLIIGITSVAANAAGSEKNKIQYTHLNGKNIQRDFTEIEFLESLAKVIGTKGQKVKYEKKQPSKECPDRYLSVPKLQNWPYEFCFNQGRVVSIKVANIVINTKADIFTTMEQMIARLPQTRQALKTRLKGTELKKILDQDAITPPDDFFGVLIYQPSGRYFQMDLKGLCARLGRTHGALSWRSSPTPTKYYLTMQAKMGGESSAYLFEANKINFGTKEKPEYAMTNQLVKMILMEAEQPLDSLLDVFEVIEKLPESKDDFCPVTAK